MYDIRVVIYIYLSVIAYSQRTIYIFVLGFRRYPALITVFRTNVGLPIYTSVQKSRKKGSSFVARSPELLVLTWHI